MELVFISAILISEELMKNQINENQILKELAENYPDVEFEMIDGKIVEVINMPLNEYISSIGAKPIEESFLYKLKI